MSLENEPQPLYKILGLLRSQPECKTCRLCEEHVGLVYLVGRETAKSRQYGMPISVTSEGVAYLGRTPEGWCVAFDPDTNNCRIYANRPLCCQLYPLDLMKLSGVVWWVIHIECPIAQRFRIERTLEVLSAITVSIEEIISEEQVQSWLKTDRTSQQIEAFSSDKPKVVKLRRFRLPRSFP